MLRTLDRPASDSVKRSSSDGDLCILQSRFSFERDRRDSFRELSPLILTEGTIHIDNSNMSIEEEVELMLRTIRGEN